MKKEISGCSEKQIERWQRAAGHEPFSRWARRALDDAASKTSAVAKQDDVSEAERFRLGAALTEREVVTTPPQEDEPSRRANEPGEGDLEGSPASRSVSTAQQVAAPGVAETPTALKTSAGSGAFPERKQGASGAATKPRVRTKMCEHRVPAGTWCKRCDA